ncbi:MAG TPA: outer membrane beta-barrel protein [Albidovulum sp.]|uniref:outer membrane protein n=1 Tax=Albidovulum sp. TaxID=1872424 RepID=UPI002C28F063|nr:outer membrane beta-barrel protein [Albidovulum sp.]
MRNKRATAILLASSFIPSAASAESGLYYGLGLATRNAWSAEDFGGSSRDTNPAIGFTLGYRADSGAVFFGGELDGEFSLGSDMKPTGGSSCDVGANGPYVCETNATVRLRGIAGTSLGNGTEVFGTAGFVAIVGESAVNPTEQANVVNRGFTFGVGVQRDFGTGKLRGELIYDRAMKSNEPSSNFGSSYDPDLSAVTAKLSYLF